MRSTRRAALGALAFALVARAPVFAAARRAPESSATPKPMSIKVALLANDEAALPLYARDTGAFERLGLTVEIRFITDAAAMRGSVAGGGIDIAYGDVISAAIAHEKDPPFVFVAPAAVNVARDGAPRGLLVVGRTSPIHDAAGLTGATVAVDAADGLDALALRRWLDTHGGDSRRVTLSEAGNGALGAVLAGKAAAASVARSALPAPPRENDRVRVLADTYGAVAGRWVQAAWMTTPVWIVRHPDEAQAFAAAMKETAAWANGHRAESAEILAKVMRASSEKIAAGPRTEYATALTPALIEPVVEMCAKYGIITEGFPAADLIDPLAR